MCVEFGDSKQTVKFFFIKKIQNELKKAKNLALLKCRV